MYFAQTSLHCTIRPPPRLLLEVPPFNSSTTTATIVHPQVKLDASLSSLFFCSFLFAYFYTGGAVSSAASSVFPPARTSQPDSSFSWYNFLTISRTIAHGRVAASSFPAAQDPSYQQPPPLQHQQRARYQATGVPSFSPPHSPHQQPLTGGAALHLQQRLAYPPQQQQGPTARHYTPQVNPAAARSTYNPQLQLSGPAYAEPGAQNNGRVPNYDTRLSAGVVGDVSFNPVEVQYHPSAPRQSKWSAALVDPLDIYDNLLYNTVPYAATERDMTLLQGGGGGDREGSHSQGRYGSRAVTAAGSASARGGGDPAGRYGDDTSSTSRYGPSSGPSGPNSGSKRARRSLSRSPPRLRGSVAAASSAGGGDHHHRSGAPQSRKSESSQRSRSRSRSGSVSMSDHRRGAGTGERGGGAFNPYGPVGGSGGGGGTAFRVSKPLLNYGTVPTAALIQHFQLPAFNVHGATQLREIDLCARFPQLYLPNDFLSVHLDHTAIHQALNEDIFSGLINSVSVFCMNLFFETLSSFSLPLAPTLKFSPFSSAHTLLILILFPRIYCAPGVGAARAGEQPKRTGASRAPLPPHPRLLRRARAAQVHLLPHCYRGSRWAGFK